MSNLRDLFDYTFVDNKADRTLFLLHGTGGTKEDLLFFDQLLGKKYNLISLQGNIDENGMARFFKRHSLGVFDQESIGQESEKLKEFILNWSKSHQLKIGKLYFLGYSNGANLLLATLFYYPEIMQNLVLLHPMLPFEIKDKSLNLTLKQIFLSIGKHDQIINSEESKKLISTLIANDAKLTKKEYDGGHEITREEISDVVKFLTKRQ